MLKFLAGTVVGWTAARTLPQKPARVPAWSPPSLDEWKQLSQQMTEAYETTKKMLEERNSSR